jgi:N-methylhydantoinase B/oxoprolinase/acetone carboxylase alpha subunit
MKTSALIPPIELEIIHNALTAAAAEMDVTIWRTSRSTIVRELLDYSTAIFDRDGWNVAQAARIPVHLNSMSYFLTEILVRHIPPDLWKADDIVISNDPYCGGQHLPDIVAFKAVFLDGRRIGFVGTMCHHLDVGGSSPGSYGSSAIEIFQEGLRIPPLKLIEQGKLNEPVRAIILQNVRQPEILWGDLQSQLASLQIGAASIERLATKVGEERFERALEQLLDTSEAGMRSVIGRIPDGTYEFEDSIDDDGITDTPIRIHAKVMVVGDEMRDHQTATGAQLLSTVRQELPPILGGLAGIRVSDMGDLGTRGMPSVRHRFRHPAQPMHGVRGPAERDAARWQDPLVE